MTVPAKDRTRAARYRAKGAKLTPAQRLWLRSYDDARRREKNASVPPAASKATPAPAPSPKPAAPPRPVVEASTAGQPWPEIEDDDEDEEDEHEHEAADGQTIVCTIKDCIACEGRAGTEPLICGKTGLEVWPPISEFSATLLAEILFLGIGMLCKWIYGYETITPPSPPEKRSLAAAITKIVQRRVGWVSQWDDLLASGGALTSYTRRAMKGEKALPEDAAS